MVINLYSYIYNNNLSAFIEFYKQRIPNLNIILHSSNSIDIEQNEKCRLIVGQYSNIVDFKNNCWKNSVAELIVLAQPDEFIQVSKNNLLNCSLLRTVGYDVDKIDNPEMKTRNPLYDKVSIFDPTVIKELNFSEDSTYCNPQGFIQYGEIRPDLYHLC